MPGRRLLRLWRLRRRGRGDGVVGRESDGWVGWLLISGLVVIVCVCVCAELVVIFICVHVCMCA